MAEDPSKRRRRKALAPIGVVLLGLVAAPTSPVAAADAPVLTTSNASPAAGERFTITLTGCDGTPTLLAFSESFNPDEAGSSVNITFDGTAWVSDEYVSGGGDTAFVGVCESGARSARLVIDMELRIMFPYPSQTTQGPPPWSLGAVRGTDCPAGGTATLYVRDGEHVDAVTAVPDAGGDWEALAPPIRRGTRPQVNGICGGHVYTPFDFATDVPLPPFPGPSMVLMAPGEGPPGTSVDGVIRCISEPRALVSTVGDDVAGPPVPVTDVARGLWSFSFTAGARDVAVSALCGDPGALLQDDHIRFDVEAPKMSVISPSTLPIGPTPPVTRIYGSDCPGEATPTVRFAWDGGSHEDSATTDLFGDWRVPAAPAPAGSRVSVEATCGSVTYDPLAYVAAAETDPGPTPEPGPAPGPVVSSPPRAVPVAGSPAYTG